MTMEIGKSLMPAVQALTDALIEFDLALVEAA